MAKSYEVPVETIKRPPYRSVFNQPANQKIGSTQKDIKYLTTKTSKVDESTYAKLMSHFSGWKGVKYQLGGISKGGVDCSGFVLTAFQSKLGINIPRSTERQSQTGVPINRSQLKTGDLVFFKTAYKVRHVGIYLQDGNFMHVSTSRGVMISNLSNVYWNKKYWKARRLAIGP